MTWQGRSEPREPRELDDPLTNAYRECFAEFLYLWERVGERSWMQLDLATRDAFRVRADDEVDRYA